MCGGPCNQSATISGLYQVSKRGAVGEARTPDEEILFLGAQSSKYSNIMAQGSKSFMGIVPNYHGTRLQKLYGYSIWDLLPVGLGTWTLWEEFSWFLAKAPERPSNKVAQLACGHRQGEETF